MLYHVKAWYLTVHTFLSFRSILPLPAHYGMKRLCHGKVKKGSARIQRKSAQNKYKTLQLRHMILVFILVPLQSLGSVGAIREVVLGVGF